MLDPVDIPADKHLQRVASLMGRSATIRPLDESVPFTLVDTLSVFNTATGLVNLPFA